MRFIRREMPMVADFCTFRIIDVSSIKELLRRVVPDGPRFYKRSDHTALADAKGSLDELRFYVEKYMGTDSD
jgi:oligoribonuclease